MSKRIKILDKIWADIIKLRAGLQSELSGQSGNLHAHHIVRKPNHFLRYDLDNGICLTAYEHRYGIHGNYEEEYRERIKQIRGHDIYDRLAMRRNNKVCLNEIEIYLKQKLNELKKGVLC